MLLSFWKTIDQERELRKYLKISFKWSKYFRLLAFCFFLQIKSIEVFAMNICEHFLSSFNHVVRVHVYVEEVPWKRLEKVISLIYVPSLMKDIGFMAYAEIVLKASFS